MWILRILTGPLAGTKFELKEGSTKVGRSPSCQIVINNAGISKEHAEFHIESDTVSITDLNSSNGIFVNGVRVRSSTIKPGDKIGLYDVLLDVSRIAMPLPFPSTQTSSSHAATPQLAALNWSGNAAPNWGALPYALESGAARPSASLSQPVEVADLEPPTLLRTLQKYIETVALPGIYKLGEMSEFRWVLGGFVLGYVVLVTTLAVIPMVQITKSSLEAESQRRALTIAMGLAERYARAVQDGSLAAFNMDSALREEGVRSAYVVASQDGHIVAPGSRQGQFPNDPFVNRARTKDQKMVEQLDSETIGAAVPVRSFDNDKGRLEAQYHAIVLYNIAGLAIDDGRITGLFVKVLLIALFLGFALFYLLFKFIEYPMIRITQDIERSIQEKRDNIKSVYHFPVLQKLVDNVNTALSRALNPIAADGNVQAPVDRPTEVANLLRILGTAAIAVDGHGNIMAMNEAFETLTNIRESYFKDKPVSQISDQSLALSMEDVMNQCRGRPDMIQSNQIPIQDIQYELDGQIFMKPEGPDFFILTLKPKAGA